MIWRLDVPEKSTVRDVMGRLAAELAGIGQFVFDAQDGEFRPDFILVLNHRLLDLRGGLGAELEDGDQLAIIQAIPGG